MPDATPKVLVQRFYSEVWDNQDEGTAREILATDFAFRGSLGPERVGVDGFLDYVASIHRALGNYKCVIEDLIESDGRAAARMVFKGIHRADFFGAPATGNEVTWAGAAFFTVGGSQIRKLWVLGDVDHLKAQLGVRGSVSF